MSRFKGNGPKSFKFLCKKRGINLENTFETFSHLLSKWKHIRRIFQLSNGFRTRVITHFNVSELLIETFFFKFYVSKSQLAPNKNKVKIEKQ